MASGDTKTEALLNILGNGGDASSYEGCCNTKTQSYILDAINRVQNVEDEVEELKNNPDVADIVATYADLQAYDTSKLTDKDIIRVLQDENHDGDSTYYRWSTTTETFTYIGESKQYTAFVGTDGVEAGTAGLVPAPATTDAGKYLKADGTWSAIGNGIKVLTSADYNYPVNNPDGIFWELLPIGLYTIDAGSSTLKIYTATNASTAFSSGGLMIIGQNVGYFAQGKYVIYQRYGSSTLSFATSGTGLFNDAKTDLLKSSAIEGQGSSNTVKIGQSASSYAQHSVAIGEHASAGNSSGLTALTAIGYHAQTTVKGGVALGPYSLANEQGKVDIGSTNTTYGYNNSNYRLLSGLYDGQSAHDAANVGQALGETESYTIATSDWSALSASSPYTYQATVTATHTIGANTVVELLNDTPVTFATYGFAIGSISGQTVTIYSIGQPSASVTLKVNYKG